MAPGLHGGPHKCSSLCLKMAHERSWVAWGRSEDLRCLGPSLELLSVSVVMDGPGFPAQVVPWDRRSPLSPTHVPDLQVSPRLPVSRFLLVSKERCVFIRIIHCEDERKDRDRPLCLSAPPSYSAVTGACVRGPEDKLKAARKG